jgi:hypothetical protein
VNGKDVPAAKTERALKKQTKTGFFRTNTGQYHNGRNTKMLFACYSKIKIV